MFKLRIETKNAAFGEDDATKIEELCRILDEVKKDLIRDLDSSTVHDINGNRAGDWHLSRR